MCDWRYGFLRCDAGFLHGKDAPAWAKWCPRCNGPALLKEARDISLVAFQQALALCAGESDDTIRAWVRYAEWPVTVPTGVGGEPIELTQQEAEALLNDALAAARRTEDVEASLVASSVINELELVGREIVMRLGQSPWRDDTVQRLANCRSRLADLTRPKELT